MRLSRNNIGLRALLTGMGMIEQSTPSSGVDEHFSWCRDALFELNSYASRRPMLVVYVIILMVYILVVLPGLFFYLKKKDRMHYLRELLVAMALLFSALIFVLGAQTRLTAPAMNYVRVLDYEEHVVNDDVYISVQIPYRQEISASFALPYEVQGLSFDSPLEADNLNYRYQLFREESGTRLLLVDSIAVTPMYFILSSNQEQQKDSGIYGQLSADEEGVSGQLQNTTGWSFKEGVLLLGNQVVELEPWSESLSVSGKHLTSRNEISNVILNKYVTSLEETDGFWFVGICDSDQTDFLQDGDSWDLSGVTIVASPVIRQNGG